MRQIEKICKQNLTPLQWPCLACVGGVDFALSGKLSKGFLTSSLHSRTLTSLFCLQWQFSLGDIASKSHLEQDMYCLRHMKANCTGLPAMREWRVGGQC